MVPRFRAGTSCALLNESEIEVVAQLMKLDEGKTLQEMLDHFEGEPSTAHKPDWMRALGTANWRRPVQPGESFTWEGDLKPGIHFVLCVETPPYYREWGGTVLTVEE